MRNNPPKKNSDEAIAKYRKLYPALDFTKAVYTGCREPMTAICSIHGEVTKTPAHWNMNGCPDCGREKNKKFKRNCSGFTRYNASKSEATKAVWLAFTADNPKFDFRKAVYIKKDSPIEVTCLECNTTFTPTPANMLRGSGCPTCAVVNSRDGYGKEHYERKIKEMYGDRYKYISFSTHRHADVVFECRKHGIFTQTQGNHLQGYGCPVCAKSVSEQELDLLREIQSFGVPIEPRNRTVISPKEIDIWIPEKNVGIEYHGLYWHSEDRVKSQARDKWEMAQKAGIRLIQIFEDEWRTGREAIINRLKDLVCGGNRLGARECEIAPIAKKDAHEFLDRWHTQKSIACTEAIGLYHKGVLVAVGTFGASRFEKGRYELLRYASIGAIQGGLSKIITRYKQEKSGVLVSYCDLRWGNGAGYKAVGFTLHSITEPDYFWCKKGVRIPRYQTQKHKLKTDIRFKDFYKAELSETDICIAAGWFKVLGTGHQKWELRMGS